jgi:tRNA (adenine57-N1/adenine58-N1)-methyltransferase catalytic subunit
MKVLMNKKKRYLIDGKGDFHCTEGGIKKSEFKKKKAMTNTGVEFSVFDPFFIDLYSKLKRSAQIIPLKDIGMIISSCGIGKESKVLEAGAGSGGLTLFLGNIAKKVVSYEIREDHHKIVKKNLDKFGLKNVSLKLGDVQDCKLKNFDVVILDMPQPWDRLGVVDNLKQGGFLVCYLPCITQVMNLVESVKGLVVLDVLEMIQREWVVEGRKVRPDSNQSISHSAFLVFMRKI